MKPSLLPVLVIGGIAGYLLWTRRTVAVSETGASQGAASAHSSSEIVRDAMSALTGTGLEAAVSSSEVVRDRVTDLPSGTATSSAVPGPTASDSQTDYVMGQVF